MTKFALPNQGRCRLWRGGRIRPSVYVGKPDFLSEIFSFIQPFASPAGSSTSKQEGGGCVLDVFDLTVQHFRHRITGQPLHILSSGALWNWATNVVTGKTGWRTVWWGRWGKLLLHCNQGPQLKPRASFKASNHLTEPCTFWLAPFLLAISFIYLPLIAPGSPA